MDLRREYDVSTEALLLRVAKLTQQPMTVFAASRSSRGNEVDGPLTIDYWRGGHAGMVSLRRGARIPRPSVAYDCTAVGYTAKGIETWSEGAELRVDAAGIPPYPGHLMPRVVGIVRAAASIAQPARRQIEYVTGDALDARGEGPRVILHLVNDRTPNWGGGFARALRDRYPESQTDFLEWARGGKLRLGTTRIARIDPMLRVMTLVAQKGYGPSERPRLRYDALRAALRAASDSLVDEPASVHMPRIGAGMAGGDWNVISELIQEEIVDRGHEVIVYSLPGETWQRTRAVETQQTLTLN